LSVLSCKDRYIQLSSGSRARSVLKENGNAANDRRPNYSSFTSGSSIYFEHGDSTNHPLPYQHPPRIDSNRRRQGCHASLCPASVFTLTGRGHSCRRGNCIPGVGRVAVMWPAAGQELDSLCGGVAQSGVQSDRRGQMRKRGVTVRAS